MTQSAFALEVRDLDRLTGPGAEELLREACGDEAVIDWAVHSVHHRPGAGVSVGYTVTTPLRRRYLVISTARMDPEARVRYLEGRGCAVWEYPYDPELPALSVASSAKKMSALLGERVSVELLNYRPTRRAVVKVRSHDASLYFGKVLRPAQAADLAQRHRVLANAGVPVPAVVLNDPRGIVLTAASLGEPLANVISRGLGDYARGTYRALMRVLDALPGEVMTMPRRASWSERAAHYAHAAATAVPREAKRCRDIAEGVKALLASSDPGPVVPTHGDFYEANVFLSPSGSRVSGLIDVDSVGPGYRVDDIACLLGHVSVLPHLAPRSYPHVATDLPRWVAVAEQSVDPAALAARCAGVTLSLVAGAKRSDGRDWLHDAMGRLEEAEKWLARGLDA